jgi:hypothetical protein
MDVVIDEVGVHAILVGGGYQALARAYPVKNPGI